MASSFKVINCYFATAWDADGAVEQMYDVLILLVNACIEAGDIPMVRRYGDFNASIWFIDCDDQTALHHVGPVRMGQRDAKRYLRPRRKQVHDDATCKFFNFPNSTVSPKRI